jgi:RNA binding exosome subunit
LVEKLEVSIEIIVHATEDEKKIFDSFSDLFLLKKEDFTIEELTGHFENPIKLIRTKISKNKAKKFVERLISELPSEEIDKTIINLESRIQNSILHFRLGKQEFVKGRIMMQEKDAIKLKIFTPIYKKSQVVETYTKLLRPE